jgi:hypothetical protein
MQLFGTGSIPGLGASSLTMHFDSSLRTPRQEFTTRTPERHDDVTEDYNSILMGNVPRIRPTNNNFRRDSPMRFKTFIGRKLNDDQTELFLFGPEHYRKAGIPYSPFSGMPVLEAHEVVNDLNRNQAEHQFVYYLAA